MTGTVNTGHSNFTNPESLYWAKQVLSDILLQSYLITHLFRKTAFSIPKNMAEVYTKFDIIYKMLQV